MCFVERPIILFYICLQMLDFPTLNRRHKAGLFLILVAAGLSLFFDASAKQTAGIVLLGLAATWFFGSVRPRTLGFILASTVCCVGLYLMIAPVWEEREVCSTRAGAYDQALSDIREAIGKATVWTVSEPPPDLVPFTVGSPIPKGATVGGPVPEVVAAWDEKGNPILPKKSSKDEHGPWEKYQDKSRDRWEKYEGKTLAKTRSVQIPTSAIHCLRPDKQGSEWDAESIVFQVR
jgi:hypothetical protein